MINRILLVFLLGLLSCGKNSTKSLQETSNDTIPKSDTTQLPETKDTLRLLYKFVDSTNIGYKGDNKIEVRHYQLGDSSYVEIEFFDKFDGKWGAKQIFSFEKDLISGCNVKIEDFNNDGFKDMTYVSATAARGANEVRTLFIFDKQWSSIIHIVNSEQFPNMRYNKKLKCIDGWIFTGGIETVFGRIEGDSLIEFASVDIFDDIINVKTIDNNGKEKFLIKDGKNKFGDFPRFKNYNPLEVYKD